MKALRLLLFVAVIPGFFACMSPQERAIEKIENLNTALFKDTIHSLDKVKARELIDLYMQYANDFPEDAKSPEYLFHAGEMAMNIQEGELAIKALRIIGDKYPNYEKAIF